VGGDHDDAERGPERPRLLDELEAVLLGHHVVHDEQVGVADNIIEASWQALVDSIEYKLRRDERSPA